MNTFSITDIGKKRQMNQDFVYCREDRIGMFPNLFIVADGMGGHNAGDFASRFAVEEFVGQVQGSTRKTIISSMEDAIRQTNRRLMEQAAANADLHGMGTTFVAATILDKELYVANIGDSRLYIIKKDSIFQVTQDHSLVEEMIRRGELGRDEARFHPNKNVITRALGANVDIMADYFEITLLPDDIVLMCSDGLSNMMDDAEMMSVVNADRDDLEKAGMRLLMLANEYGGKDNISILLVSAGA